MKTVVLISGPSGSGKSTMRRILKQTLGHRFNDRIAGVEVDDIYRFIDPRFNAKNYLEIWQMARESTGHLARGMLLTKIDAVFIFGNTLFSDESVEDVLKNIKLDEEVKFYHVTLAPTRDTVASRLKKRQHSVPDWLDDHLAERQPYITTKWTNVIDNSQITPEETLKAIYKIIEHNKDMNHFMRMSQQPNWFKRVFKGK
ncbi:AAA family ATPase [Halalkalibacter krulwichiae]|uniref:Cytidylate kinase n=1 Tax=Halalkalibacter krulwichiae TaxID=199441 RepID=A0A1X9M8I8_9BACI|nr:AAA family ATPase [Halalkalibacter krulwichiae]ARK29745.1 Cytidylate kinase [Halalkalibacter krulwichiae]